MYAGRKYLLGADYSGNPNVKAFLQMIARAEGTYGKGDNGYNILFGGGTFTGYTAHPNKCIPFRSTCSTAAGRYQFLKRTWDSVKSALGLPDFSPRSQDLGAIELLKRRGALQYIVSGDIEAAISKSAKEWASFPGAGYGQGEKSMTQMLSWYNSALGSPVITQNNENTAAHGATLIANDMLSESGFTSWLPAILITGFITGLIYYNYK